MSFTDSDSRVPSAALAPVAETAPSAQQKKPRPPLRPQLVVRVGVTGHRPKQLPRDTSQIETAVTRVLGQVRSLAEEIAARVAAYEPPEPAFPSGVMAKYAKSVSSASEGAITS